MCGGQMEVFIEPLEAPPALFIFGAGHVGYYLARVASDAGFEVHVVDDRAAFANRERFPFAASVVVEDIPTWLAQTTFSPSAYAVIVTRGHRHDLDALQALASRELRYLGLIGSRAKVARLYDQLLIDGRVTLEQLSHVHAPIGLDIGAVTPQEIAVSIARRARRHPARQGQGHRRRVASLDAQGQGSRRALAAVAAPLLVRNATILTMNDAFDVIEGDVLIDAGRIVSIGDVARAAADAHHRRWRRLPPARLHPDAHPSVPDALPRLCRRPRAARLAAHAHLAHGGGAHAAVARGRRLARRGGAAARRHDRGADDGDGARHRCGVRGARADGPARRRRQVHDGRRPRGAGAAARAHAGIDGREPGAGERAGTAAPTGGCARRSRRDSRVSCSRELLEAVAHLSRQHALLVHTPRVREPRRDRAGPRADRARQHRLSVRAWG